MCAPACFGSVIIIQYCYILVNTGVGKIRFNICEYANPDLILVILFIHYLLTYLLIHSMEQSPS
jgi:hypothetical protein